MIVQPEASRKLHPSKTARVGLLLGLQQRRHLPWNLLQGEEAEDQIAEFQPLIRYSWSGPYQSLFHCSHNQSYLHIVKEVHLNIQLQIFSVKIMAMDKKHSRSAHKSKGKVSKSLETVSVFELNKNLRHILLNMSLNPVKTEKKNA